MGETPVLSYSCIGEISCKSENKLHIETYGNHTTIFQFKREIITD